MAELRASRRPAILIPYPHVDKHQEFNAQALEEEGIAKVIFQTNLSGKSLAEAILDSLYHPETFTQIWSNNMGTEEKSAAEQIVTICLQLAKINTIPI